MLALRTLLSLLPLLLADSAGATTVGIDYSISIRGFPVGSAKITADVSDGRYTLAFSGGVRGIARLFTDAKTTAKVDGRVGKDRLEPEKYSHVWTDDNEVETVDMHFVERGVTDIVLEPPRKRPERYVPLTSDMKADALDPLSAFLWPGPAFEASLCDRTLPLVDGRRLFHIVLRFSRMERVKIPGASAEDVIVCSFRYVPIAGHRLNKKPDGSILDSGDAEVWLAQVADGMSAPVRVQFRSRSGQIVMRATEIRTD